MIFHTEATVALKRPINLSLIWLSFVVLERLTIPEIVDTIPKDVDNRTVSIGKTTIRNQSYLAMFVQNTA